MKAFFVIGMTIMVAYILSVIPLPDWLLWVRPEWPLLVLVYWALALPERCGVFAAGIVGLLQDSLTGAYLGKHVLSYCIVIGIIHLSYKRLRMFDVWQQAFFVFLLLGLNHMIEYWTSLATGAQKVHLWFLLPAIVGGILWPWVMALLRKTRRSFGLVNRIIN